MKLFTRTALIYILGFVFLTFAASTAAWNNFVMPTFPTCPTVNAPIKVHYDYGWHQIIGENGQREGSDTVYSLGNQNYTQCFCPLNGNTGIQTNWFASTSISGDIKSDLIANGWINARNGLVWGLDNENYLAKNSEFACNEVTVTPTPTVEPTPSNAPQPTPTQSAPVPTPTNAPIQPTTTPAPTAPVGNGPQPAATPTPTPFVCPDAKPGTPSLSVTRLTNKSVKLTWNAVSNATTYTILYGRESGKYTYSVNNTGNITEYTISDLEANQKYFFVLQAKNNCQSGERSNVVGIEELGIGGPENPSTPSITLLPPTGNGSNELLMAITAILGTSMTAYGTYLKTKKNA